jgi:chromosome segregation ATPase
MNDMQEQLNSKDNELNQIKEGKKTCDFQRLKIDYDLLQLNFEKNKELYDNLENKYNLYENDNKRLNERAERIEKAFSNLINGEKPKIKDINEFEIYNEISENLRDQITEIQNAKETLEKRYNATSVKSRKDYKALEDKYLELYEKNIEMQKIIDDGKNNFINDTMKLNNEISNLNDKIKFENKEKEEYKNKYDNLLKDLEKNLLNFENLQNIMTKLREKDDIDITLIEERFILLENILELEKNEISNVNSELINKVKIITQKKEFSARDQINSFIEEKEDKDNDIKLEIKNLSEENKFFKQKIKEQEKRLLDLNKKTNILNIFKEENKTLKNNLNENNVNLQVIIKELINKKNQLNEELLQSRKRTSLLRSNPSYEINNKNMKMEIEKYQKEIESLKNEIITQKIKDQEEIERIGNELSSLKTKNAADAFEKDNEIMKCKALIKKYKDLLESNGILKKK